MNSCQASSRVNTFGSQISNSSSVNSSTLLLKNNDQKVSNLDRFKKNDIIPYDLRIAKKREDRKSSFKKILNKKENKDPKKVKADSYFEANHGICQITEASGRQVEGDHTVDFHNKYGRHLSLYGMECKVVKEPTWTPEGLEKHIEHFDSKQMIMVRLDKRIFPDPSV